MSTDTLHEYQLKFLCLSYEAEYIYEKLTEHFSILTCNNTTKTNPQLALAYILDQYHQTGSLVKIISKLKYDDYKNKVFEPRLVPPDVVKNIISICQCDITFLYDILTKLDAFPTYIEKRGPFMLCKDNLKPGNHNRVCCNVCLLCKACGIGFGTTCNIHKVREALTFLKEFRNMGSHIKNDTCEEIEKGTLGYISIPNCVSWNDVLQNFEIHTMNSLHYLKDEGYITESEYKKHVWKIKAVIDCDSEFFWTLYSRTISRLAIKGWSVPEIERVVVKKFTVKIDCPDSVFLEESKFVLVGTKLCLDLGEMKSVINGFRDKAKDILIHELAITSPNENFRVRCSDFQPLPEEGTVTDLFPLKAKFDITFADGIKIDECYYDFLSNESERLWQQIKKALTDVVKKELNKEIFVKCTRWKFSSIHLTFKIFKADNFQWTVSEIEDMKRIISSHSFVLDQCNFGIAYDMKVRFPLFNPKKRHCPVLTMEILVLDDELVEGVQRVLPKIKSELEYKHVAKSSKGEKY